MNDQEMKDLILISIEQHLLKKGFGRWRVVEIKPRLNELMIRARKESEEFIFFLSINNQSMYL